MKILKHISKYKKNFMFNTCHVSITVRVMSLCVFVYYVDSCCWFDSYLMASTLFDLIIYFWIYFSNTWFLFWFYYFSICFSLFFIWFIILLFKFIISLIWNSTLRPRLLQETTTRETTERPTTTQSAELAGGSTITAVSTISPYLKPGASYLGKTSSTRFVNKPNICFQ